MRTFVTIQFTIGTFSQVVLYQIARFGDAFGGGTKFGPKATVDLDRSSAGSLTVQALAWSTIKSYVHTDVLPVSGRPDWYRSLRTGAQPIASKALGRKPENLVVWFAEMAGATHAVEFTVSSANRLLPWPRQSMP